MQTRGNKDKDSDQTNVKSVEQVCLDSCQAEEELDGIHCVLCNRRFHMSCVDITDASRVWSCPQCRQLPSKVDLLLTTVNKLVSLTQEVLSKREEDSKTLRNIDLEQTLASENITTINLCVQDIQEAVKKIPVQNGPKPSEVKKKIAIVGDSLLRDVKSESPDYTVVSILHSVGRSLLMSKLGYRMRRVNMMNCTW